MAKKKKAKVRTLTEKQYNDYLMALKDGGKRRYRHGYRT